MQPVLVDSHCHLNLLDVATREGGLQGVVDAAAAQGVAHMLCACVTLGDYPILRAYSQRWPQVSVSVGVHPNDQPPTEPEAEALLALAREPAVVAVGETGLDYFRSTGNLDWQRERFRRHIAVARQVGKPLIIHCRDARADTLELLETEKAADVGGVMHCFVEDWDTARRAMDLGFHISFSGIVTFKNARELKEVARRVPGDRLLVETDAPYLAPVPYRGKPNEPAYVRHVAEHVAELRGESLEALSETTTANYFALFRGAARPAA